MRLKATIKLFFQATTLILALATSVAQGGVLAPAVAPAIPAPIAYHHAIPFNVPPYSDRVDIHNKILSFAAVPALPALPAVHAISAVPTLHAIPHGAPHYAPGPVATPVLPHHVPFAYGHPGAFAAPVPAEFGAPFVHPLPAAAGPAYAYDHPFVSAPAPALTAPFLRR